ncbi:unnamed protein product [Allacma fusca]|uniref:Uncharacterized protein n=1 Tax=Allacma fusca TaxID=39272 RepID=A0A8J2K6V7_9HEXA|nr:unnamed protein product [Allacma fusca]
MRWSFEQLHHQLQKVKLGFGTLGNAITTAFSGAALMANPFGLLAVAISAVIAGLVALTKAPKQQKRQQLNIKKPQK